MKNTEKQYKFTKKEYEDFKYCKNCETYEEHESRCAKGIKKEYQFPEFK